MHRLNVSDLHIDGNKACNCSKFMKIAMRLTKYVFFTTIEKKHNFQQDSFSEFAPKVNIN